MSTSSNNLRSVTDAHSLIRGFMSSVLALSGVATNAGSCGGFAPSCFNLTGCRTGTAGLRGFSRYAHQGLPRAPGYFVDARGRLLIGSPAPPCCYSNAASALPQRLAREQRPPRAEDEDTGVRFGIRPPNAEPVHDCSDPGNGQEPSQVEIQSIDHGLPLFRASWVRKAPPGPDAMRRIPRWAHCG